jgi:uncharacterized membrane protein YdjX (TVP38/TMEM64 family)
LTSGRKGWLLVVLLLIVLVAAAFGIWYSGVWRFLLDRQALEALLERLGPWGPIGIIILEIGQVVIAPVPGQITALAAGYLFGVFWGTVYTLIGLAIGTTIATWLARRFGRPLVEHLVSAKKLERIDNFMERRGAITILVLYLMPFTPDDVVCYASGLTRLSLGMIVFLALIGRTPGLVATTWIGAHAAELSWQTLIILVLGGIALAALFAHYQERIESLILRLLNAINPRR